MNSELLHHIHIHIAGITSLHTPSQIFTLHISASSSHLINHWVYHTLTNNSIFTAIHSQYWYRTGIGGRTHFTYIQQSYLSYSCCSWVNPSYEVHSCLRLPISRPDPSSKPHLFLARTGLIAYQIFISHKTEFSPRILGLDCGAAQISALDSITSHDRYCDNSRGQ